MVQFFKPKKNKKPVSKTATARVAALDHQARGVIRSIDKRSPTRFVIGALPGELIQYRTAGKHSGLLEHILEPSNDRREAPCRYYQDCGGCDFQHADEAYQRAHKQQVVAQLLQKFGVFNPDNESLPWQPPLISKATRYRRRVRLATRWLGKEQRLLIGFREAQSHHIVPVHDCLVADDTLLSVVNSLYPLLNVAAVASRLGHIEAINTYSLIILLRITDSLPAGALQALQDWQQRQHVDIWLQTDNELKPLAGAGLPYDISIDGDTLYFQPGDFLQVNNDINARMVQQAMDWLQPDKNQRVYDFFAGTGNFSLPLARRAQSVLAVEGVQRMAEQVQANAEANGINNLQSLTADLTEIGAEPLAEPAHLWCLDPARPGAEGVVRLLCRLKPEKRPQRILYVSCAADTLARDLSVLTTCGYRLTRLGTVDMFPQTHHIETMVCLERAS